MRPTEARKRVDEELENRGLLLVEGSFEIPSVAGVQAGNESKTGGFSWDSAPALTLARALAQERDVARLNLFRGKDTLVHRRLWPALNAVALHNVEAVIKGAAGVKPRKLYYAVQDDPGITSEELKAEFESDAGGRGFGLIRADLQAWLCILHEARTDTPSALPSDLAWFHWKRGRISRLLGSGEPPPLKESVALLISSVPEGTAKPAVLFPCLKLAARHN